MKKAYISRSKHVVLFLAFLFVLLLGRLFYLQVIRKDLIDYAKVQHEAFQKLKPLRGSIFERNGLPLAMSHYQYTLKVAPHEVQNKEQVAKHLHRILGMDLAVIQKRLNSSKKAVYLKRRMDDQLYKILLKENVKGVYFDREQKREYPKGKMASHVIGFVGADHHGLEGLEAYYEQNLKGEEGFKAFTKDGKSRELLALKRHTRVPQDGYDLVLTLDERIQYVVEREMAMCYEKYKPKSISVIVIDPRTGELLSLANIPSFDLNQASKSQADDRRNRAIADTFEPGSTFKIVTFAAALNEGLVQNEDKIFCENGRYKVKGRSRPLHDHKPHGWLTVHQIMQKSSNIGTAKIAQKLGEEKLYDYMRAFGFGRSSGLNLLGEVEGVLRPVDSWSKASIASLPMGQEIGTTAIQMVYAMGVIANKGYLMAPKIVKELRKKKGVMVARYESEVVRKVVSKDVAQQVSLMLESVVSHQGTARRAMIKGIRVAGKTGTAQKYDPKTKRYSKNKYVGSFIGFFPADNPRYCIGVFVDEPPYVYRYGGVIAAPIFQRIGEELKSYVVQ